MQTSGRVTLQQSSELPALQELQSLLAAERAERARLQSELELRNCALDTASTHFMIIDVSQPDWSIVYVNRAICERHGYKVAELLGQSPALLVCAEKSAAALERVREAVGRGTNVSVEIEARRKDRTTFSVGMSLTPIRSASQGVSHYLCVGADITARLSQERAQRQLQEQLYNEMRERERMAIELRLAQKLESVGRLAAGIAHEINTPIQYVGDSVYFLRSACDDFNQLLDHWRHAIDSLPDSPVHSCLRLEIEESMKRHDMEFIRTEIPKAFERTFDGVARVTNIVKAMKEFAHPDAHEQ